MVEEKEGARYIGAHSASAIWLTRKEALQSCDSPLSHSIISFALIPMCMGSRDIIDEKNTWAQTILSICCLLALCCRSPIMWITL